MHQNASSLYFSQSRYRQVKCEFQRGENGKKIGFDEFLWVLIWIWEGQQQAFEWNVKSFSKASSAGAVAIKWKVQST